MLPPDGQKMRLVHRVAGYPATLCWPLPQDPVDLFFQRREDIGGLC